METQELVLPGGWLADGERRRRVRLRPITGRLEEAMAEAAADGRSLPERLTALLGVAVASIGGVRVDDEAVASLCIGDRRYLAVQVARRIDGDQVWLRPRCCACGAPFDVGFRRSQLPVKAAGQGFPSPSLDWRGRRWRLRLPSGRDQAEVVGWPEARALSRLLHRCVVACDDEPVAETLIRELDDAVCAAIDTALDEASPDVATEMTTHCPECDAEQRVALDLTLGTASALDRLLQDVHRLASRYHWSEAEILSLSRDRRARYLRLIDHARGMHG